MARIRKIYRNPKEGKNYYVIDACFLVNKYIPPDRTPTRHQRRLVEKCLDWWNEIDQQLDHNKARVYIPDLCIAESFKALAKKYYVDKWFLNYNEYRRAKSRLIKDVTTSAKELSKLDRTIRYHDISTSRDLIIAVDRFFERFFKNNLNIQLPDLILLATAKYLKDFYDIPSKRLHIVTCDRKVRDGAKLIRELPYVYDPTQSEDSWDRIFTG